MNRLLAAVLAALILLSLAACGGQTPEESAPSVQEEVPSAEPSPPSTEPDPIPDPVEESLDSMTLAEKVGQLFFVRCPAENAVEDVILKSDKII